MFTAGTITNADTSAATLTVNTTVTSGITLEGFGAWRYETEGTELPYLQASGSWGQVRPVRRLIIAPKGKLVGSSASNYWTHRTALAAALLPPEGVTTDDAHGTLSLTTASAVVLSAAFYVLSLDMPLDVQGGDTGPTVGPWAAELLIPLGFVTVSGTPAKY